jgi:ribokinase
VARILILGSVNLDRVWRLEAPLRAGGRTGYREVDARVGGGGFNTGCALIALGHDVAIAASLAGDGGGRLRLEALVEQGSTSGRCGWWRASPDRTRFSSIRAASVASSRLARVPKR